MAWVALLPLLVALAEPGGGRAFRLGYVTGVVSFLGMLYWTALVVAQFGGLPLPVAVVLMVLLCLVLAVYPALFAWMVGRWLRALGPAALLLAPLSWVATEILRAHTLYGFSWCLLGSSQQPYLPVIQLARATSVYGISALLVSVPAALAYALFEPRRSRRLAALALTAALVAAVLADGTLALARPWPESGRVRVGLVQASILQEDKWVPGRAGENVGRHVDLTRQAAARGAGLVVWPESALPGYFDLSEETADLLRGLVRETGVALLFGNDDREDLPGREYRVWVGAKLLTPQGDLAYRYHKVRLVPFGEFVPLKPLLSLGGRFAAKLVQEVSDFTPGTGHPVAELGGHRLATFICYEAIFPDHVRGFTSRGAELLVNLTNDAWYGRTSAPHQHLAQAVFRAVENRRFLVRAANTGFTAVVDPHGRVLESTRLFERTVLVRDVAYVGGETFYTRHGDVFAWSCLAAALALTLATVRRRRGVK